MFKMKKTTKKDKQRNTKSSWSGLGNKNLLA